MTGELRPFSANEKTSMQEVFFYGPFTRMKMGSVPRIHRTASVRPVLFSFNTTIYSFGEKP